MISIDNSCQLMGNIQKGFKSRCLSVTSSSDSFSLNQYSQKNILSNGQVVVRLENGELGIYFEQLLTNQDSKQSVQKWSKSSLQQCCNVLKYDSSPLSLTCGTHQNFKVLLEYGDITLTQIVEQRQLSRYLGISIDRSQQTFNECKIEKSVKILQMIKLFIEIAEEVHNLTGQWVILHTSDLVFFRSLNRFKYLYLPIVDSYREKQSFFDPERITMSKRSEQTTIFSLGMVLMSLILQEDASECYDFRNFTFCLSAFEEKKEKLEEFSQQLFTFEESLRESRVSIYQDLISLTLDSLVSWQKRPNISGFKQNYFKILRKLSLKSDDQIRLSTKREQSFPINKIGMSRIKRDSMKRRNVQKNDQNVDTKNLKNNINDSSISSKLIKDINKTKGARYILEGLHQRRDFTNIVVK